VQLLVTNIHVAVVSFHPSIQSIVQRCPEAIVVRGCYMCYPRRICSCFYL